MATWEEARVETMKHWEELLEMIGKTDPVSFSQAVNTTCGFCDKSEMLHYESGRGENRCDFCEGRIQAKGCPKWIPPVVQAAINEDWDRVRVLIQETIEEIRGLDLPPN